MVMFTNENFVNALPKTPDLTLRLLKSLADKVNVINQKYTKLMLKNSMLVIGLYFLGYADQNASEQDITIDANMLVSETTIDRKKIRTVLSLFRKNGLIDNP